MTYARSFGQIQMGTVPATFLVKAILKRIENDILTTRGVEVEDVLRDHTSHDFVAVMNIFECIISYSQNPKGRIDADSPTPSQVAEDNQSGALTILTVMPF